MYAAYVVCVHACVCYHTYFLRIGTTILLLPGPKLLPGKKFDNTRLLILVRQLQPF